MSVTDNVDNNSNSEAALTLDDAAEAILGNWEDPETVSDDDEEATEESTEETEVEDSDTEDTEDLESDEDDEDHGAHRGEQVGVEPRRPVHVRRHPHHLHALT